MNGKQFDYVHFREFLAAKEAAMTAFLREAHPCPLVMQVGNSRHWGAMSQNRFDSLEEQLQYLTHSMALETDAAYGYLEPWHGTGVYAAAFGCETVLVPGHDAQVRHLLPDVDALADRPAGDIRCAEFRQILDTIDYFKEETAGRIPISVTDTQSPNDTGSLIMDSVEFIASCLAEPELLAPFLDEITQMVIDFTEVQMRRIGPELLVQPGHQMPSGLAGFRGVAVSDDNMAFVSPAVYEETFLPYNSRLGRHFGGISLHSCGKIAHTLPLMLKTENLQGVECAVGRATDPCPNDAADLAPILAGSGVLVKVRLGPEEIENVRPLVRPDIRLVVQLVFSGRYADADTPTRNALFAQSKAAVRSMFEEAGA